MSVTIPFEFDGSFFKYGRVKFAAPSYMLVEDLGLEVPSKFALRLMTNAIGSWELLEDVARAPLRSTVKTSLLEMAAVKGIESARATLEGYLREAPNGRPRFYREHTDSNIFGVHLTDGRTCLHFSTSEDLGALARGLPPNVYVEYDRTNFTLNLRRFNQASAEIDEFFNFVARLNEASYYIAYKTCERCFRAYFDAKAEAYRMLAEIEKVAGYRAEREKLYGRLKREGVIKCKGGFVVSHWDGNYYVTDSGKAFKLKYSKGVDEREAILKLVKKGVVPRALEEVNDMDELSNIARVVGRVCPQLAVVMSP